MKNINSTAANNVPSEQRCTVTDIELRIILDNDLLEDPDVALAGRELCFAKLNIPYLNYKFIR